MDVDLKQVDDILVVTFKVESLDSANSRDFKADMGPVLEKSSKLVFDISSIRFIDSTGLGFLVYCLRRVHALGGDVKLCGMSKPLRALFELVRMHQVFEVFDGPKEAVAAFKI